METQKSLQDRKSSYLNYLKDFPKKIKQVPVFEYRELKLNAKKNLFFRIRNLSLLDLYKLHILERYLLVFFDIASYFSAFYLAQLTRYSNFYFQNNEILYVLYPLVVILMVNYVFGLYKIDFKVGIFKALGTVLTASFVSLLFISFIIYLFGVERFMGNYFGRGILLGTISSFSMLIFIHRFFLSRLLKKIRIKRSYLVLTDLDGYHFLLKENKKLSEKENFDFLDPKDEKLLFSKWKKTIISASLLIAKHCKMPP